MEPHDLVFLIGSVILALVHILLSGHVRAASRAAHRTTTTSVASARLAGGLRRT